MTQTPDDPVEGFSSTEVSRLARVPPSTLQYWVQTGMVDASLRGPEGRRVTHYFSLTDLLAVRAVRTLREAGCPLQTLRSVKQQIRERWNESLSDQYLYWDGDDLHIADQWGNVRSAVKRPEQTELRFVALPLSKLSRDFRESGNPVDLAHFKELRLRRQRRYAPAAEEAAR